MSASFGADETRIFYIGLKGEYTKLRREVVHAKYELKPQLVDHKNPLDNQIGRSVQ